MSCVLLGKTQDAIQPLTLLKHMFYDLEEILCVASIRAGAELQRTPAPLLAVWEVGIMQTRRLRPLESSDSLPEQTRYRDDGCDIHPACLSCPLPQCRYDEPYDKLAEQRKERNAAIMQAFYDEGLSVADLISRFNVSRRTIHRVLQAGRSCGSASDTPATGA